MKKTVLSIALASSILFTSCLGQFAAFNKLRDWNDGLTDNKFLDNLIFWALNIVPVYGLFFLGDAIIFNVIEFWSGSNPVAMAEGEYETQYATVDGVNYKMTATKNSMTIEALDGENKGQVLTLTYNESESAWFTQDKEGNLIKLSGIEDGFQYVYLPNGEAVKIDYNLSAEANKALIDSKIANYEQELWALNK